MNRTAVNDRVVVIGATNIDMVAYTDHLPGGGETVVAHEYHRGSGGKGANQAVASARAGAHVWLVSAVGDDVGGREGTRQLKAREVRTTHVFTVGAQTGIAMITVTPDEKTPLSSSQVQMGASNPIASIGLWPTGGEPAVRVLQSELGAALVDHAIGRSSTCGVVTEVQTWISKLAAERSPTTDARVRGVLVVILDGAVKDNRITTNPARELKLPRKTNGRRVYLSHQQVERLAVESKYPDFVRFLAYTGLRWGEATGLKLGHVDPARRRLRIEENAVSVNGHVVVGTPKTHERRSAVYPAFLDAAISTASQGKSADMLLCGDGVNHLTQGHAHKGWFMGAVKRVCAADERLAAQAKELEQDEPPIMPRVTPHELRHTAASLAISAGANVKAVQRMLGHASAAMTLDRYADRFKDDLDSVAEALDAARHKRLQR